MNKKIILSALFALTSLLCIPASQANSAHPVLSFDPLTSNVEINDVFSVDIVISGLEDNGLDEIVSAFDLDFSYDSSILQANSVSFGFSLGDPSFFEAFTGFDVSNPGFVNLSELSLLSDSDLQTIQGNSIVLASIEFTALGDGISDLVFLQNAFGYDVKGLNASILQLDVLDGSVNVASPVPVPAALPLMVSGLAFLGFQGRRKQKVRKN